MNITSELKAKLGTVVGVVAIRKPQVYTERGYECAAWWEERTSTTGIFPLTLQYDERNQKLIVCASIPAKVSADHFPALFCGNAIGTRPTVSKSIDQPRLLAMKNDIYEAIKNTGGGYAKEDQRPVVEWFVALEFWPLAISYHESRFNDAVAAMPKWYAEYQAGEDLYFSRIGMVAYFGEIIAQSGRIVSDLKNSYRRTQDSTFFPLYQTNTAWAKGVQS